MDNLEKAIQEINDKIGVIDGELEMLKQKKEENKDKIELGYMTRNYNAHFIHL